MRAHDAVETAPTITWNTHVYDMTLLLLPAIWLMAKGRVGGFLPWEKAGLVAMILLPALAIWLAGSFGLSLGPVAPLVALLLVLRRGGER